MCAMDFVVQALEKAEINYDTRDIDLLHFDHFSRGVLHSSRNGAR